MTEPDITSLCLDRAGIRAASGDLEAEIMEAVWRRPLDEGVTVREVWGEIHPKRAIMYTTVTRLARKRLLVTERKGHAYEYKSTLGRDAFRNRFVAGALDRFLINFSGATPEHIRQMDDPLIQWRITRLLEDIERRRGAEESE